MNRKITQYFSTPANKKIKLCEDDGENYRPRDLRSDESKEKSGNEIACVENVPIMCTTANSLDCDLPDCWTMEQKEDFCCKYEWLIVKNKKLGCKSCSEVGKLGPERTKQGMNISQQWSTVSVTCFGESKADQMTSLRKKIFTHKESSAHQAALKILSAASEKSLESACVKALENEKSVTANVFRTAYKVAKKNQSFNDFESEIDVQELNGLDMGRILHSRFACVNIVNHIAAEMKARVIRNIIESHSKISLILDESSTISQLSSLIIYVRAMLPDMKEPTNIFLDLIDLESVTAEGIFNAVMNNLKTSGFHQEFLNENLISVATDGAAVMLGSKKGVVTLMKQAFPQILSWHCANHKLELSVGDVIKKDFPSEVNHFKYFLDKLYTLYHQSPKNARELRKHAEELESQILKIGRVLGTRWVASSFRSVSAVWKNYEALVSHFTSAKSDVTRDNTEKKMYEGLLKKITSTDFILNLGLMCDALQELSDLSLELQARDITLHTATKKIKTQLRVFEERKVNRGPYYSEALKAKEELQFKGISLQSANEKRRTGSGSIDPTSFYGSLCKRMESRLLNDEDDISSCTKVLDPSCWPDNPTVTFGEEEIKQLCQRFRLPERKIIRGFREFLEEKKYPASLLPLLNTINSIPISTSECERGFSQMNLVLTPLRASLHLKTVANLIFIKLVGPPLRLFDPTAYVETWFLKGRHLATDIKSKERKREKYDGDVLMPIWKLL